MSNHEQLARAVGEVAILGEDQDDNQLGISAGLIHGLKKTVYNSKDYGTIVLATYATAS